jgi:hypothetical protein
VTSKKRTPQRCCKVCLAHFKKDETNHPDCDESLKAPGKRARTSAAAAHEKVEKAEKDTWVGIYRGTETKTAKAS